MAENELGVIVTMVVALVAGFIRGFSGFSGFGGPAFMLAVRSCRRYLAGCEIFS